MRQWIAVLALAITLAACSSHERADNPEGAVHLFIAAARSGDRASVYQRLGPETRARIEATPETASVACMVSCDVALVYAAPLAITSRASWSRENPSALPHDRHSEFSNVRR